MKIRRWRYKRGKRAPYSSFMSFSLRIFELCRLNILRVLSKKTLEINKELKDSFVPDPILAKVVKYSTLTILLSFRFILGGIVKVGHMFGGFSTDWAHYWRKEGLIFLGGDRYESQSVPEGFSTTIVPYVISLCGVFSLY
jgi:hypothetical protein